MNSTGTTSRKKLSINPKIKMPSFISKISTNFITKSKPLHRHFSAAATSTSTTEPPESQTQKLERITDTLLDLTKIERYDYSILFSHKLGFNKYGPAVSGSLSGAGPSSGGGAVTDTKVAEKTAFDVKLEKFDAAAKIKIIKEVRSFTEYGLKEAKELVEKAPVVLKKGVTKEEADSIVEKLKVLGATVVLE